MIESIFAIYLFGVFIWIWAALMSESKKVPLLQRLAVAFIWPVATGLLIAEKMDSNGGGK